MSEENKLKISVYLDSGNIFEYFVDSSKSAREHSSAIIKDGYRHNDGKGTFEHFPPHRISKIKVSGGPVSTKYTDEVTGT